MREAREQTRALLEKSGKGSLTPAQAQHELQEIMWRQAGPFRTGVKLAAALERIRQFRGRELAELRIGEEKSFNLDIVDGFELRAMLTVAEAVAAAARSRTESRGAHQREDFPETDDALLKNQILELRNGELKLTWSQPVQIARTQRIHG
jgi:succinate dehydrogenase/fumarate reductase flavoprotein subunit